MSKIHAYLVHGHKLHYCILVKSSSIILIVFMVTYTQTYMKQTYECLKSEVLHCIFNTIIVRR